MMGEYDGKELDINYYVNFVARSRYVRFDWRVLSTIISFYSIWCSWLKKWLYRSMAKTLVS